GRCSVETVFTTGTGASGEMRPVSPNQYSSSIASPATRTRTVENSGTDIATRFAVRKAGRHSIRIRRRLPTAELIDRPHARAEARAARPGGKREGRDQSAGNSESKSNSRSSSVTAGGV